MTEQEKEILKKHLDNIQTILEKVPNTQIEGSTESKIVDILEKINQEFDITYMGKYL